MMVMRISAAGSARCACVRGARGKDIIIIIITYVERSGRLGTTYHHIQAYHDKMQKYLAGLIEKIDKRCTKDSTTKDATKDKIMYERQRPREIRFVTINKCVKMYNTCSTGMCIKDPAATGNSTDPICPTGQRRRHRMNRSTIDDTHKNIKIHLPIHQYCHHSHRRCRPPARPPSAIPTATPRHADKNHLSCTTKRCCCTGGISIERKEKR